MPGQEERASWYSGDRGRLYHEQKRSIPEAAFDWVAESRARKFQPFVKPSDTVLEYGVGYGWNLARLHCGRKIGFDAAGFLQEEVQKRGIEFVQDTAELPSAIAQVVICHHTLEHLRDPLSALSEMRRLVFPSGWLLLTVPFEKERRYRQYEPKEPNHHLYSWNCQTFGNLLLEAGLSHEQITLQRYGYDRFAARWAARFGSPWLFQFIRSTGILLKPSWEISTNVKV